MDGWVRVLRPFNSISVISRRWKDEHERLCAMKRRLGSGRISPPAGFEPATPWSEVGSANRSATQTLHNYKGSISVSAILDNKISIEQIRQSHEPVKRWITKSCEHQNTISIIYVTFHKNKTQNYCPIQVWFQFCRNRIIWATSWENLFMSYAKAQLISAFVFHCLDSITPLLAIAKISRP